MAMTKISSNATSFYKRIFPFLALGILGSSAMVMMATGGMERMSGVIVSLVFGLLFIWFLFRALLRDLVDEVHDRGESLQIRNGGEEETVPLSNIREISMSKHLNPTRVTLRLVTPGRFGTEVVFIPVGGVCWVPPANVAVIDDLMARVDQVHVHRG